MIHLCRKIVEYYILFLCYTYYIVEYNTLLLCIYLEELLTNGLDNSFLMGKSKTESGCPQYKLLSIIVSTSKYLRASDNIYISTVFRLLRGGCEGPPPHPGLAAALQPE